MPEKRFTDKEKWCPRCKSWKLHKEFYKKARNASGLYDICIQCCKPENPYIPKGRDPVKARLRQKKYIMNNLDKRKETAKNSAHKWRMFNLYHLTPEKYKEMYEKQDGKCAIKSCQRQIECIEHNHLTGETRGLTCKKCNTAIGFIDDNPQIARDIALYLEQSGVFYGK